MLISGGYCILEEGYSGLVICPREATGVCKGRKYFEFNQAGIVHVLSSFGTCTFKWNENFAIEGTISNTFIKSAVEVSSEYLSSKGYKLDGSAFNFVVDLSLVFYTAKGGKTGLGSSAVVTTLLVAAIVGLFEREITHENVHSLALRAHFQAQGKIGSGFDISAAVFGSQLFVKGSPQLHPNAASNSQHFPLHLPQNIEISLFVCGNGSSTTSFASKFAQFKAQNPAIIPLLAQIETLTRGIYQAFLHSQCTLRESLPPLSEQLLQAYSELSQKTGIEIVPEVIRRKCLHFLHNENSVLCAGISGAGGFDAFYIIYDASVKQWPFLLHNEDLK